MALLEYSLPLSLCATKAVDLLHLTCLGCEVKISWSKNKARVFRDDLKTTDVVCVFLPLAIHRRFVKN